MRIALVANPCSGGNKTRKCLPLAEKKLHAKGMETDIYLSRYDTHIQELAMDLDIQKYDAVVGMGEDGTNFHLINGLLSRHRAEDLPPVGIIPAGSGNSFVRDLEIFTLDQAVEAIKRNRPKPVDVILYSGRVGSFYFVNLMGLGFVTDVAVDGKIHSGDYCFVEFCNSRFTGGNMLMAPDAEINDGLMDIVLARGMTRTSLLTSLPKIFRGTHLDMARITCIKGASARIIPHGKEKILLPDGEILAAPQAPLRSSRGP